MRCAARAIALALCATLLAGCATHTQRVQRLEQYYLAGDAANALVALDQIGYPRRDRVLYLMDQAILLRMDAQYEASNAALEQAKALIDELTAASVTETVAQFTLNDAASSYVGSPLEHVLIHVYAAFNYLDLGRVDAARVEALQLDQLTRQLGRRPETQLLGNVAFAHYLSGIIFEDLGEWSDAMIAYRKAYEAYQQHGTTLDERIPQALKTDLLRLSEHMGLAEENRAYQREFNIDSWLPLARYRELGEIIVFFHDGLVPIKREHSEVVPLVGHGQLVRVSLPAYYDRGQPAQSARVTINDQTWQTEPAMNIARTAHVTLEKQMPGIIARSAMRNVVKYQTAREAGRQDELAGLAVNIFNVLTESADTRSWLTLPAEIQIARIALPPGSYDCEIAALPYGQHSGNATRFAGLHVDAGTKLYLSYRWTPFYARTTRH
ncbi:MAG: hypothetical protein AMJ69_06365 [Gammaproteobacteria bacterium SG8_47]|nr:MAG: hypothetical protein AMJ69_06365 [Gammaproteobacteria bacterium SG8_47]